MVRKPLPEQPAGLLPDGCYGQPRFFVAHIFLTFVENATVMIGWLRNLQRCRRIARVLDMALRTERNAYNVMATARMYYEVLYGWAAPF